MTAPRFQDRSYTREEYLRWCAMQPQGRFERVDGRIIAISPERVAHARVKGHVYAALAAAIHAAGIPCEAFTDGVTVHAGDSDYEPDALVNCGARIGDDEISAPNPIIIVEVLSQSTDTGGKLADYFLLPSVAHYLIVHPTKHRVIHHRRTAADLFETAIIASGEIRLDPPGIIVTLDAFYADGAENKG